MFICMVQKSLLDEATPALLNTSSLQNFFKGMSFYSRQKCQVNPSLEPCLLAKVNCSTKMSLHQEHLGGKDPRQQSSRMHILLLTFISIISQLLADHISISSIPKVITHCPPLVIDTHLHSTLILIGASYQTNISICTVASGVDYVIGNKWLCHTTESSWIHNLSYNLP